jgi:hypothetical protein
VALAVVQAVKFLLISAVKCLLMGVLLIICAGGCSTPQPLEAALQGSHCPAGPRD